MCNFEFGDNDYGLNHIIYDSATVYYKDLQTTVRIEKKKQNPISFDRKIEALAKSLRV
jgi:hypothetical protein